LIDEKQGGGQAAVYQMQFQLVVLFFVYFETYPQAIQESRQRLLQLHRISDFDHMAAGLIFHAIRCDYSGFTDLSHQLAHGKLFNPLMKWYLLSFSSHLILVCRLLAIAEVGIDWNERL
jgi:hypothetical protein